MFNNSTACNRHDCPHNSPNANTYLQRSDQDAQKWAAPKSKNLHSVCNLQQNGNAKGGPGAFIEIRTCEVYQTRKILSWNFLSLIEHTVNGLVCRIL